jgi:MYXO-CTERM domain-containing protein
MRRLWLALLLLLLALPAFGSSILVLPNGGAIQGLPGQTVGWSFTLYSLPEMVNSQLLLPWMLVTNVDFVPDPAELPVGIFDPYMTALPNLSVVIGADTGNGEVNPWAQTFDAALMTGVGGYTINSFQSPGDHVSGQIRVLVDVFLRSPNDPLFNPVTDTLAVGRSVSALASVSVVPSPEPASVGLGALGLLALAAARTGRRKGA